MYLDGAKSFLRPAAVEELADGQVKARQLALLDRNAEATDILQRVVVNRSGIGSIEDEFKKPYYEKLDTFIKNEYSNSVVYPPVDDIFNAFHFTPLSKVKVLLLGQDPYHNENQAHGLSFSVLPEQKEIPPSLKNIYKELQDDCGCYVPSQ